MDTYTSDEEQVEKIKKWLREYGPAIAISLVLVIIGFFSWQYWQRYTYNQRAQASMQYEALLVSLQSNDRTASANKAQQLMDNFSRTPYAKLAGLILARVAVQQNQIPKAMEALQWVVKHGKTPALQQMAQNHLARLYIAQKQPEKALKLLSPMFDKTFAPAINAIRGDALLALGKRTEARQAYQQALSGLAEGTPGRDLLLMKFHDLA